MSTRERIDFIVVGSGIAGLATAIKTAKYGRVLLLTKGSLLESNTSFAQGGIAAALAPGDTPESHRSDTLIAGADLCEPDAVSVLVQDGPERVRELIHMGARFDTTPHGDLAFGREGAHSIARVLHRGDATGAEIANVLAQNVLQNPQITVVEKAFVTDLMIVGGRCVGCWILLPNGSVSPLVARACVIATGGCGQIYRFTTNPWVATGDGMAMAYRAGAPLVDMEFFQFHPTALAHAENPMVLISEAVRGEGATLVDENGIRFMQSVHPQAELAPRDIVARAIFGVMQRGGSVRLDATAMGEGFVKRFPTIYRACQDRGIDPRNEPIPVAPGAHFIMGGIQTNTYGQTGVPGLYACGEVACTGVHGANRLASNSLLEGLVFAERIAQALAAEPRELPPPPSPPPSGSLVTQADLEEKVRGTMWDHAGVLRTGPGLAAALRGLDAVEVQAHPHAYVLRNMITVSRLVVLGALHRTESRGGHYREDHSHPRPEWQAKHVVHLWGENPSTQVRAERKTPV